MGELRVPLDYPLVMHREINSTVYIVKMESPALLLPERENGKKL